MILGVVASSISKDTVPPDLNNNIIAYWGFNGDAKDSYGIHDGSINDVTFNTGKMGNAIYVPDNTSAGVTIPTSTDFTFGDGVSDQPFSVSMYVYWDVLNATTDGWLMAKRKTNLLVEEWQIGVYNGMMWLVLFSESNSTNQIYKEYDIGTNLSAATWYHLIFTYDGSGLETGINIYIDNGLSVGTAQKNGTYVAMESTIADVTIGWAGYNATFSTDGRLDGVAIWDKELTISDRLSIYNTQNGGDELVFEAEYQAILDRADVQGYTKPSTGQQTIQNQLMLDLKSNGIFAKRDIIYIPANDGSKEFAGINWKAPSAGFNLTIQGTVTWTSNVGFKGDGTTGYLTTQWNINDDGVQATLNSTSFSMYISALKTVGTTASFFGGRTQYSGKSMAYFWDNGTQISARVNSNSNVSWSSSHRADMLGMNTMDRTSSLNVFYYIRGSWVQTDTRGSLALNDNIDYYIGAKNENGTAGEFSDHEWGYFDFGSTMSATEHSNLSTLIDDYITAIVA